MYKSACILYNWEGSSTYKYEYECCWKLEKAMLVCYKIEKAILQWKEINMFHIYAFKKITSKITN